jgi:predicted permease
MTPRLSGYDAPRTMQLYDTLLQRFANLPGVTGAALSQPALLSGSVSTTNIYVEGDANPSDTRDREHHEIHRVVTSPNFLEVMGIRVVRGRPLSDHDDRSAPHVAVINETAARTFFRGSDPVGRRFGPAPDHAGDNLVVGVVADAKYSSLREPPPPTMYVTYQQAPRASAVFELRTSLPPSTLAPSVREVVHQVDPNLPVMDVATQIEQMERRLSQEKLFARAYTLFGGTALLLASIGLFGLMSYTVVRRTAEMGIRMALGARRVDVVRLVMTESLVLVGIGVAGGLALTAVTARFIASLLFGVPPHDSVTVAVAVGAMVAVSAIAAYLPARRASLVDPLIALRYE